MVAPNGARRTKADHPALPVTIAETVATAKDCWAVGAEGIHAHIRDNNQQHILDAGLYKELIAELHINVPKMAVQITTEAVDLYTPQQQSQLVVDVQPTMVSVALCEMLRDENTARHFYSASAEAGITIQHILYSIDELKHFIALNSRGFFATEHTQLLFVLGRYTQGQQSHPNTLDAFIDILKEHHLKADWAVCAFSSQETQCAKRAFLLGGKARIGFENSLWNDDGRRAENNAERIIEVEKIRKEISTEPRGRLFLQ